MKKMDDGSRAIALLNDAIAAGTAALEACVPEPMTVISKCGLAPETTYVVDDGVCGFAWVRVPGNSWFIRALKKVWLAGDHQVFHRDEYAGGYMYWVGAGNQSYERKMAFAKAMAEELRKNGVECSYNGRLD
jgi:hypothetical protein